MNNLYLPNMRGCTDANCLFQDNSKGMHTNGGCNCEKSLRRVEHGFDAIRLIHYLRKQLQESDEKTSQ